MSVKLDYDQVVLIMGANATGKNLVANYLVEIDFVDTIVSFREQLAKILKVASLPSEWTPENFEWFQNLNNALVNLNPYIVINMVEREVIKTLSSKDGNRIAILDVMTTNQVAWASKKQFPMLIMAPSKALQRIWYERKYNASLTPGIAELGWNKYGHTLITDLVKRKRKNMALIQLDKDDADITTQKAFNALGSILKGDDSKVW